jgi:hypothetical protein
MSRARVATFEQWCGLALRVRCVDGLVAWAVGRKASDSSLISTPFEGMPASLGPGLRTASGACGHRSMFATGPVGRDQFLSLIDAQFPPLSAARRGGSARRIFRQWHRPHNTATRKGGLRRVPAYPVPVTAVDHFRRRKCLFSSKFHLEPVARSDPGRGLNSGPFRRSESGTKPRQNTAIYCHFFHQELLVRCRHAVVGHSDRAQALDDAELGRKVRQSVERSFGRGLTGSRDVF